MTDSDAPAKQRTALEAAQLHSDNVKDKVFVVTGAYSGIGVETTKALLATGAAMVIVGGRDESKLNEFVAELHKEYPNKIVGFVIDLADLDSVKQFAKTVSDKCATVDVLILNAGVMMCPPAVTKQGHEMQMGTNVIGHFLLAKLLVAKTKRQVWLSSRAHTALNSPRIDIEYYKKFTMENTATYNPQKAYQQSKLGDILLAKEFHKRYSNVEAASCHPGVIQTNLGRHFTPLFIFKYMIFNLPRIIKAEGFPPFKTVEQGASTTITVATLPSDKLTMGGYYSNCAVVEETESAKNMDDAKALFDYCDEATRDFQ